MGCVTEITTLHQVRGRVRLNVPQIRWSPANTAALKALLRDTSGVYHFKACVHVGSVLIYYDSRATSPERLIDAVHGCPFPQSEDEKPREPPPLHAKQHQMGIDHSHAFSKGGAAHTHYLVFDLVKHGLMAGSAGPMSGHVSLAFAGLMAVRMLKRKTRLRKERMK